MTDRPAAAPIHCAYSELRDPTDLRPHPANPNKHPDEQLRLLTKAILARGWRHPVIVSRLSGCIVAGHARQTVAIALRLPSIPVDFQEFGSEAEEMEFCWPTTVWPSLRRWTTRH
jgi:hypothetical protein